MDFTYQDIFPLCGFVIAIMAAILHLYYCLRNKENKGDILTTIMAFTLFIIFSLLAFVFVNDLYNARNTQTTSLKCNSLQCIHDSIISEFTEAMEIRDLHITKRFQESELKLDKMDRKVKEIAGSIGKFCCE
jgi:hypothetical protein